MGTSRRSEPSQGRPGRQAAAALCCLALLAGCGQVEQFYDSKLSLDTPIDWWHQLQGGEIAEQRPPPPGVADPYPNLGQIPARPTPTDPATRGALLAQLAGQRDRTKQLAAQDPIVFSGSKPPAPTAGATTAARATPAPAVAPAAPADPETSTMVLDAANTTPPAAAAPPPTADPNPPAAFTRPARPSATPVSGPVPALPGAAPALPQLAGLPISVTAPVVLRATPAARFSFAPGSSALPASAEAALRALASQRTTAPVAVVAGGDARSAALAAQQGALPLALRRTGAITAALVAAGVPAGAIRAEAVAPGREASIRLVE